MITGNMDEGRTRQGGFCVYLYGKELDPTPSQNLFNHSPDGFAWGYGGSGPAQLALAILYEVTGDEQFALAHYQDYKGDIIAKLKDAFSIDIESVKLWIRQRGTN